LSCERKEKINLANLKQKMNIFVLVRFDVFICRQSAIIFPRLQLVIKAHVVESRQVNLIVTG